MDLIYQPKGAAQEYCKWAVNFYNGCSNMCSYCYNRKGRGAKLLGADKPELRKCFRDIKDAELKFAKDLYKKRQQIIDDGGELFFNFVSDPFLKETQDLNIWAIWHCTEYGITPRVLTKMSTSNLLLPQGAKVGFTLTGCDEEEPGADSNKERIKSLQFLNSVGVYTWASIEPVINTHEALKMVMAISPYCNEIRIGLLSQQKKTYSPMDIISMVENINWHLIYSGYQGKLIYKDSVNKFITFDCNQIYLNSKTLYSVKHNDSNNSH